jgi:hypothetical protein
VLQLCLPPVFSADTLGVDQDIAQTASFVDPMIEIEAVDTILDAGLSHDKSLVRRRSFSVGTTDAL